MDMAWVLVDVSVILYVWSVDLRLRQSFKFQISMLHENSREAH